LTCVGAETFVSSVMIMSGDENQIRKLTIFQSLAFTSGHRCTEKFVYGVRRTFFYLSLSVSGLIRRLFSLRLGLLMEDLVMTWFI
jgi:hypothetical protein